jgi:hypothetical protein
MSLYMTGNFNNSGTSLSCAEEGITIKVRGVIRKEWRKRMK